MWGTDSWAGAPSAAAFPSVWDVLTESFHTAALPFGFLYFFIWLIYMYLSMWLYAHMCLGAHRGQKPLLICWSEGVWHRCWDLNSVPSDRISAFNHWVISLVQFVSNLKRNLKAQFLFRVSVWSWGQNPKGLAHLHTLSIPAYSPFEWYMAYKPLYTHRTE